MKPYLPALLIGLIVAEIGLSADTDQPVNYTKEEIGEFVKKAEAGDPSAMTELGTLYVLGQGIPKNETKGIELISAAAQTGYVPAQINLACRYLDGIGVQKNYKEAVGLLKSAAAKDDPLAQCILGDCYKEGQGVPRDYEIAASWFRKAAASGHSLGQFNLASCYLVGEGMKQDMGEAEAWFRKAAEGRHDGAQYMLALLLMENTKDPSGPEIIKWMKRAANQGYSAAQAKLAELYSNGQFVEVDLVQAYFWFNLAAAEGDELARQRRDALEGQISPQQISQGQKMSRAFVPVVE
jgi:uncharacterized protein